MLGLGSLILLIEVLKVFVGWVYEDGVKVKCLKLICLILIGLVVMEIFGVILV